METLSKFPLSGTLFALSLVFGFWLSHAGKPYNGWLFNIHKLIALAAVIVTANQMIKFLRSMESQTIVIVLLIVAALCVIVVFASGALMSAGKLDYALMLTLHRAAPVLLVIGLGLALLLINSSS